MLGNKQMQIINIRPATDDYPKMYASKQWTQTNPQWTQNTIVDQFRTSTFVSDSRVRRNGMVLPLTLPLNVMAM